ncbi:MAG TPA: hypothetical protein QF509_06605, partial [Rhodospirillales bacterium]|nr:hypothetical protein [Rhodospirillales bacterium]
VLFELNTVQRRVNEAAERQMASAGRIRILALKARQPGISTYVEGRFYWKTTRRKGVRAFILTHRDQATNNLFAIAKRFHDNCPPAVKPQIKVSNAKELDFLRLVSGYRVGTAKAEGVGRADTIQKIFGVDEEQALELSIMFIRKLLYHAAVVIVEEGDPSEPSG